jgi:hypothetical protein
MKIIVAQILFLLRDIVAAKAPAPIPLSMFTTAIPRVQLCNIVPRAAVPLEPNP